MMKFSDVNKLYLVFFFSKAYLKFKDKYSVSVIDIYSYLIKNHMDFDYFKVTL